MFKDTQPGKVRSGVLGTRVEAAGQGAVALAGALVDISGLDIEGEGVLSAPRDERPNSVWEIDRHRRVAQLPRARSLAAAEVPRRSDPLGALQHLWDLQHREGQFRLVIVTDNSD